MNHKTSWIFAVLAGMLSATLAHAQQPPPAADPPGRRVFVPLEELHIFIKRDNKSVILSRDEFNKLYAEAQKNTLGQPTPPQTVGVGSVQYAGKIVDDQLLITATLDVTKFSPGWQTLPLDITNLAVEKANLGDQPARLGRDPQSGQLVLLLDQPGKQKLTLELSRPLVAVGSDKLAAFGLSPRWPAEFTLEVPAQKHLQWNGVAVERPAANDQPAQFKLAFGGQKQIELRITDRPTLQASDGLVFATSVLAMRAAPEEVTWQALTSLQVFGKPLDQLQFRIPEALQIISITSPGLESWEFGPNGPENGETILNLRYRQPFQEPRDVTLQGVLATKTGETWQVPNLKLANVASHVTQVVVTTAPGMRLQVEETVGVQRTAEDSGTKELSAAGGVRFDAWREDFVLRLTTQSKAREISAAVVTMLDVNANGLDLQTRATVETKFAPLFDASLTLPAEWIVTDVLVNQKRVAWESVPHEAGVHLLRVTFDSPLPVNQFAVIQLSAHRDPSPWPLEEGTATIPLPEVRVLQTNVVEGTVVVAVEQDLDVQPQDLKGLVPAILDPALAARLSYEYQDTHYSGQIVVRRKPSRISATTLAFHRLDKEVFQSHLEARLNIEGGGVRKLEVSLPESAGTNLRFELPGGQSRIVEQTPADPANGRIVWTLLLDQRAHGDVLLYVDVSQARQQAKEFVPPSLQVLGVERETGKVAFEAESDQQLDVTATNARDVPLPDVDPTDLPVPTGYLPKERIVAAYSYVLPGYRLKLGERRFARVAVPTAICDQLAMISILGETGELQHEATFQLRAVGVQSLQVVLPEKARLWATLLDDAPIEVRKTKTAYLIPFTAMPGATSDAAADPSRQRTLKLFYRTEVPPLTAASQLRQVPPGITVLNGDGSEQPLEILKQSWTIYHPDQTEFVADSGSFVATDTYRRSSFLGDLLHSFQVDSPVNLFWKLVTAVIGVGIVWFVGYLYRHFGVNRLAMLLGLIACCCLLFALLLPATQQAREAARRTLAYTSGDSANFMADGVVPDRAWRMGDFLPPSSPAPTAAPASPVPASNETVGAMGEAPEDVAATDEAPLEEMAKAELKSLEEAEGAKSDHEARTKFRFEKQAGATPKDEKAPAADQDPFAPSKKSQVELFTATKDGAMNQPANRQPVADDFAQNGQAKPEEPAPQAADPDRNQIPAPPVAAPNQAGPPRPSIPQLAATHAVLSLALNLEPPPTSRSTTYTYQGRMKQKPPELVISYQNRSRLSFAMLVVQVLMVLICWFARHRSIAYRGLIFTLGTAGPLGLMTIVPEGTLPFLDGVLYGTLLGAALWLIVAICHWFTPQKLWRILRQPVGTAAIFLFGFGLATSASQLSAQEQAPAAANPMPMTPLIDADTLIVPFDNEDPLKSNRVFLPYEKFIELYRKAHPEEPEVTQSPIPGTIAEALYTAELVPAAAGGKPSIKMTGRFVCYTFRNEQVALPFPIGPIAVSSAQLDGTAAPLVPGNAQQPLAVLISKPGLHVVDLQFSVPAQVTGPAGSFGLDLGFVPAGTVRFKVPDPDLTFRVNGSSGAFRRVGQEADAALIIPISSGGQFHISWQPKQNRGDVESIVHVESTTAILLAEGGTRLLSHWNFQVRQGSISEALFSLPPQLSVRKIEGQDVGGWETAGEGDNRVLKIFLRRKVEDATQLKFDLFLKQPADDADTTYSIPNFAPQNVTRETGTVAVVADKQFAIRVGDLSGLSQIEPQQVPVQRLETELKAPVVLGYRFANRPYQLELVVTRRQPQLKVTARHLAQVDTRKVQQQNRFHFKLTGAPRAGVAIVLPQGYLLQSVDAPDVADWHVSGREDSADMDAEAVLHLEFPTPRVGELHVTLVGKTLRQSKDMKAEASLPYAMETDELETQLLTSFDPIYTATVGVLDNWKSIDPTELMGMFQSNSTTSQLAFASLAPAPSAVPFDLHQAAPRLSANTLTLLAVGEESLDYLIALQWQISSAGADTFVFTTPDWLAGKLDFPEGQGPRRRGITQESLEGGRVRWTVTLEDPQREGYFLVGRAILPPSATGDITIPNLLIEQVQPGQDPPEILPLESQTHYIVLVNQSQTQLTSTAGEAVVPIPAEDLTRVIKLRQDLIDQAAEIVRVQNPRAPLTWKQQRFKAEQLLPAAVNLAHHITVLAYDGSWREQVTYRLKNRKRQFLAIKLPPDSQVLSLFVKGQPARPVLPDNNLGFTLIPLPKTVEGDVSFEVTLVLAGQLTRTPFSRGWGLMQSQVEVPIPSVVKPEENAEYGIPVSQTTWTVYVPKDMDVDVLKSRGRTNLTAVTKTEQELEQEISLLTDVSEMIAVNSGTYNRRAKAQSLNNLKQLNAKLHAYTQTNVATNPKEATKQQELQQRAVQLKSSIDKLVLSNSAEGLIVQEDRFGNSVVVDNNSDGEGQDGRLNELLTDNGIAAQVADEAILNDKVLAKPEANAPAKGNLNRDSLRGQNFSQVQELAVEQKSKGIRFAKPQLEQAPARNPQSYLFLNDGTSGVIQEEAGRRVLGGVTSRMQMGNGDAAADNAARYGASRDLARGGRYSRSRTSAGLERQTQSSTALGIPGPGAGGMPGAGGPMAGGGAAGMGMGGMMGGGQQAEGEAAGQWVDVAPQVWTSAGGLSLLIDIPRDGNQYNFSKISGDARLTLGVRPHQTWQLALGLVWTAVWAFFLLLTVYALSRPQPVLKLQRELPWFLAALGAAVYFLVGTNSHWGIWGLVALLAGSLCIAFRRTPTRS